MAAVEGKGYSLARRLTLLLAVDAGLRPLEIAGLRKGDVDFKNRYLTIGDRLVPILTDALFYALKEYFARGDSVISKPRETTRFLTSLNRKCGFGGKHLTSFELKHVFSANFLNLKEEELGHDKAIEALGDALGHSSRVITERYVREQLRKEAD